jgi:hypothetical protein
MGILFYNGPSRPHRSNIGKNKYDYHDTDNNNGKYILVTSIYFAVKLIKIDTNFVFLQLCTEHRVYH